MIDENNLVIDLVRHSGLNAIAQECHRQAVARGKYNDEHPYDSLISETTEWFVEMAQGNTEREAEKMGDLLHTVLRIAHHRGIDTEQVLRDAMRRTQERAKGERVQITPKRLAELQRIAEATTPEGNAQYIATFDPSTVLALLDEIERLMERQRNVRHVLRAAVNHIGEPQHPYELVWISHLRLALQVLDGRYDREGHGGRREA